MFKYFNISLVFELIFGATCTASRHYQNFSHENFTKDRDTLIEQSVFANQKYFNKFS